MGFEVITFLLPLLFAHGLVGLLIVFLLVRLTAVSSVTAGLFLLALSLASLALAESAVALLFRSFVSSHCGAVGRWLIPSVVFMPDEVVV